MWESVQNIGSLIDLLLLSLGKKRQLVSPVHLQSHFIVCRALHIPLCIFSFLLAETEAEYQVNVTGLVRLIIALRKESLEERVHPSSVHECKL